MNTQRNTGNTLTVFHNWRTLETDWLINGLERFVYNVMEAFIRSPAGRRRLNSVGRVGGRKAKTKKRKRGRGNGPLAGRGSGVGRGAEELPGAHYSHKHVKRASYQCGWPLVNNVREEHGPVKKRCGREWLSERGRASEGSGAVTATSPSHKSQPRSHNSSCSSIPAAVSPFPRPPPRCSTLPSFGKVDSSGLARVVFAPTVGGRIVTSLPGERAISNICPVVERQSEPWNRAKTKFIMPSNLQIGLWVIVAKYIPILRRNCGR